jgi:hypothetical protein
LELKYELFLVIISEGVETEFGGGVVLIVIVFTPAVLLSDDLSVD